MNLLKKFGLGLLYAILSPVLLAGIALVAVFSIPNFFYQFVLMIVNFFRGKTIFPPYEEDEEAYRILQKAIDKANNEEEQKEAAPQQPPVQNIYVQQTYYTNPAVPPQQQPPYPGQMGYQPGAFPPPPQQMPPYPQQAPYYGQTQLPPGAPQPQAIPSPAEQPAPAPIPDALPSLEEASFAPAEGGEDE